ncbi:MAG: AtpZ/AtpI family protein [Bacillota bacterium]
MTILRQAAIFSGLIIQLGLIIVVSIYLGFRLGGWLDALTGQQMLFKSLGAAVGVASGFSAAYRIIMNVMRQQNSGEDADGDRGHPSGDEK